jgi:hypothetical protein
MSTLAKFGIICGLVSLGCMIALTIMSLDEGGDVIVKHISTTNRTVDYEGVTVNADMTFFWIDTHSERDDFNDERICMGAKLHLALMESIKHCKDKGVELTRDNDAYFYTCLVKFFYNTKGPFGDGRDWLSFNIKSVTFPIKDGQSITFSLEWGDIINPYYKENYYFKNKFKQFQTSSFSIR